MSVILLLWMIMGYLVVTAVLVVPFGRLGDMFGRVRIYNLGFVGLHGGRGRAVLRPLPSRWWRGLVDRLACRPGRWRRDVDGLVVGNSHRRISRQTARHGAGSEHGRRGCGVVPRPADRRFRSPSGIGRPIFWVGVPIGVARHDLELIGRCASLGSRTPGRLDWAGLVSFGLGLTVLLVGITYGIQPYGDSPTGGLDQPAGCWARSASECCLLVAFCLVELRVEAPMVDIRLFKSASFGMGNLAGLMSSVGRGGLQFMLDHLVAGHLASVARLQFRVHAVVGGHLPASRDVRLPGRRARWRAGCPTASGHVR